jgi:hypothetical protein
MDIFHYDCLGVLIKFFNGVIRSLEAVLATMTPLPPWAIEPPIKLLLFGLVIYSIRIKSFTFILVNADTHVQQNNLVLPDRV